MGGIFIMFDKLSSYKDMSNSELSNTVGGKWHYWGNGVYTNGNKVRTDWNKAWRAVGRISYGAWAKGLGHIGGR